MDTLSLLTKIESPTTIREYLNLQLNSHAPVHLIVDGCDEPLLAKIVCVRAGHVDLECPMARHEPHRATAAYSLVGKLRNGCNFLACGEIDLAADQQMSYQLTFPRWVDVSQSRDSFRCLAPSGHFLHLSASDCHLNDIVCKLHDISFEGLAFEWQDSFGDPHQTLNAVIDDAILMAKSSTVHLGQLRIVHVTRVGNRFVVGCAIVSDIPSIFDLVVLNVQRSMRRLV